MHARRLAVALGLVVLGCRDESRAVRPDEAKAPKVDAKPAKVEPARVPKHHRAEAAACPRKDAPVAPFGKKAGGPPCSSAADCSASSRCVAGRCRHDDCYEDPDCGPGSACACDPLGQGHRCVTAGCRVDSDCAGGACSPTFDFVCGAYHGVIGFQCHSPADACVDDQDCVASDAGSYCAHEPKSGRWVCGNALCKG